MAHDRAVHPAVRGLLQARAAGDAAARDPAAGARRRRDGDARGRAAALRPHLEVRTEALLYLTAYDHIDPLERIEQLGDFQDFSLRAAMAAFLARPGRAQNLDAAQRFCPQMVDEAGPAGRRTRLEAARLLAILPDVFDRELRELLDDDDGSGAAAIAAVGALQKRSCSAR